jgi:hypothetical protein
MAFSMQKRPMDYNKYMDEYKANLQLQISNNNRIYNAVSQANQGIDIPTPPADTRSLSEKIGDIQNLKSQLSVQLRQITDGSNADMIVNRLNDDELARAVQYFQILAQKLKTSYALGVPADVFVQALQNYSVLQDESAGIDMGLQGLQKQSNKILLSLKNIAEHGLKPTSVKQLITFGKSKKVASPAQLITLTELEDILYSLDDLKRISELPLEDKTALEKELSDIYPKLPSQESFEDLFNYLQTIDDPEERKQKFDDIMDSMNGLSANDAQALRAYKMPRKLAKKVAKERAVVASVMAKQAAKKAGKTAGQVGKGMHGSGMVQFSEPLAVEVSESKPKTKKAIRITGNIEKPLEYIPFGKYILHKYRLNDSVLMLRSKSNNSIPTLPPQKISPAIASILKQIIVGGSPSFEAISGLDADDKELLHKIVRLSHIELSVPTPDLTKTEQYNHRFQLLRGQLLAGNSSQEVIKELKQLLLMFISNNTIPKAQANAVMYELMVLSK